MTLCELRDRRVLRVGGRTHDDVRQAESLRERDERVGIRRAHEAAEERIVVPVARARGADVACRRRFVWQHEADARVGQLAIEACRNGTKRGVGEDITLPRTRVEHALRARRGVGVVTCRDVADVERDERDAGGDDQPARAARRSDPGKRHRGKRGQRGERRQQVAQVRLLSVDDDEEQCREGEDRPLPGGPAPQEMRRDERVGEQPREAGGAVAPFEIALAVEDELPGRGPRDRCVVRRVVERRRRFVERRAEHPVHEREHRVARRRPRGDVGPCADRDADGDERHRRA